MANRRKHRRYATAHLWVTELSGDYKFVVPASDLSEGGIFLKGRLKTEEQPSQLRIHLSTTEALDVSARPVHDIVLNDGYGAGYQFLELSASQAKALRSFLRNLD